MHRMLKYSGITRDGTVMVTNWALCCAYRWPVTPWELRIIHSFIHVRVIYNRHPMGHEI